MCPPITALSPWPWSYSKTGMVSADIEQAVGGLKQCKPSMMLQPRFAPPCADVRWSISSKLSCPTSPIHKSPVTESTENRHGFLNPYSQISARPPEVTKGLPGGI